MALRDVIAHFASGQPVSSYVVTRRSSAGTTVLGRWTPGTPETITVDVALVVPASAQDLKVAPEGRSASDLRKFISATEIKLQDVITIDGESWEVYHVDGPYNAFGDTHWNASVARQRDDLT
jgi:hypothetical protein